LSPSGRSSAICLEKPQSEQQQEVPTKWLLDRSDRQKSILSFAKKKKEELSTSERSKNTAEDHHNAVQIDPTIGSPDGGQQQAAEDKGDRQMEDGQSGKRKNILTQAVKVAGLTLGVTAIVAKEAVNAILDPKQEMEKVRRLSQKAAKKIDYAASKPKEAATKVASFSKKCSKELYKDAKLVTKGTLGLGLETVEGTVGFVTALIQGNESEDEGDHEKKEDQGYNREELLSRRVPVSFLDRVTRVVEGSLPPNEKYDNLGIRKVEPKVSREMPHKLGSCLIRDGTGMTGMQSKMEN
jgi:hypothetical protein